MAKKTRKTAPERRYEAHIYMEREDYERLKRAADRDLRSVTAQAWHYIRLALASEE